MFIEMGMTMYGMAAGYPVHCHTHFKIENSAVSGYRVLYGMKVPLEEMW